MTPCAGVTAPEEGDCGTQRTRTETIDEHHHTGALHVSETSTQAQATTRHAGRWSRAQHTLHAPLAQLEAPTRTRNHCYVPAAADFQHVGARARTSALRQHDAYTLSTVPQKLDTVVQHAATDTTHQRRNGHPRSQSLALRHIPASLRLCVSPIAYGATNPAHYPLSPSTFHPTPVTPPPTDPVTPSAALKRAHASTRAQVRTSTPHTHCTRPTQAPRHKRQHTMPDGQGGHGHDTRSMAM